MRDDRPVVLFLRMALVGVALLLVLSGTAWPADEPEIPVVDGHLGSCTALFTVLGKDKKPVYDAKIDVVIHYGFLGLHKLELQVGTNSEGKAKVAGLIERPKQPLEFHIVRGAQSKTVLHDPAEKCNATIEVILGSE